jgi:hypothetical protein
MMYTITREAYEGDIVSRLRNWRGLHLAHGGDLFEEAADEIEALRGELEAEARINGMGGEREARLMAIVAERESEIARLRRRLAGNGDSGELARREGMDAAS